MGPSCQIPMKLWPVAANTAIKVAKVTRNAITISSICTLGRIHSLPRRITA